ncbi:hypothetical protein KORDIASMS9_03754 [Kordia sp. SMS9]|uniref:hypothetical protein n=1 Tax=Kordia sp. SMS9 TaxID=2282170 RepID=UPI000E0D5DEF|nr:hypothetical protein [Kordia sp. SMS9]AXG71497.1 hypothetical protein KORDIASMS9_03754 [Kordia sp. SMS9]
MKKSILNIGTVLTKSQQSTIHGGDAIDGGGPSQNLKDYCGSLSIVYHHLTNDPEGDGISAENDALAVQTLAQWNTHCIGVN